MFTELNISLLNLISRFKIISRDWKIDSPQFQHKNDNHIMPWVLFESEFLIWKKKQVDLKKKLVIFPLFNFCLMIPELWNIRRSDEMTSLNNIFSRSTFDVKFNYMPYVKWRFKKDSLLILPYSELLSLRASVDATLNFCTFKKQNTQTKVRR